MSLLKRDRFNLRHRFFAARTRASYTKSNDGLIVVVTNLDFIKLLLTTLSSSKRSLERSKCSGFTLEDSEPLPNVMKERVIGRDLQQVEDTLGKLPEDSI
ncbi:hypothetical protein L3Y34_010577 [Caenorhabditis briggsae]|uniref:Uncharacterized protein n=1 Tax=Caenorhabditis briggsae TaxID=6238 RepID=A0AAE8ZK58_CAEBR|nr:hypothetical protein L3Y34_010577 [Caenorhabditis briggsae]